MLDLAALLDPLSVDDFVANHWPDTPYWSEDGPNRAEIFEQVAELADGEAALNGAGTVHVFRPDGMISKVDTGSDALPLYKFGLTCTFGGRHIPGLADTAHRLAADLSLPDGSIVTELFCSSGGSGARMHSDYDVNFALLVRGRKRWRIAPNEHIRNQTKVCLPGNLAPPDPAQLDLADRTPFPERMPDDATALDIGPGGLVFLPRGWWHETESDGDCLQVNFVANRPDWVTVLTRALQNRLSKDPHWRAYAFDMFAPPPRGDRARQELKALLAELPDLLDADAVIEDSGYEPA